MRYRHIISGIDLKQPLVSWIYTAIITVVGILTWVYAFPQATNYVAVLFFALLVTFAESMHVRLPHANGFVSVGSAVCLAAVYCLPTPEAVLATSLGVIIANLAWAAIPLDAAVFNWGQLALNTYLSSMVFQILGGTPLTPITFPVDIIPMLVAMATYAVLNVSLVTLGIALAMRKPVIGTWLASIRWALPNYSAMGPLGVLAAVIYYSSLSMYGILLLWVPLLFARYSFQQYWEIRQAHIKTIEALALALDARDPYTSGHSERVAIYASSMATLLKMSDTEVERVRFAGILHDIGKIGISDLILNKKGSLNNDEYALIQGHPGIGADMVQYIGFLKEVSDLIRHHHERYDGTGYPDKLGNTDIPLGARILGVVDAFDAMTCDRVYRPALSPEEAIARLNAGRGTQFDPEMVDCFLKAWETVFDHGKQAPLPARQRHLVDDVLATHIPSGVADVVGP